MNGIRLFSVGAGVLSGLVITGALGYGLVCGSTCDKGYEAGGVMAATTPVVEAGVLADVDDDGCDKPCPKMAGSKMADVEPQADLMANVVAQPGAAVGDQVACPVSGEVFTVAADSPTVEIDGETVFVCCDRCTGVEGGDGAAMAE